MPLNFSSNNSPLGPRHLFIPDTQVRPGVPIDHIEWAAKYAAVKQPHTIVIAGDWYDMPSLSSYDVGKRSSHGRTYVDDIEAGTKALELFERTLAKYSPKGYNPRKVVTLGNHEYRIERATENDAKLFNKLSLDDLAFKKFGWKVIPFLKPVLLDGITYIHYCPLNAQGQVTMSNHGCPTALAQARRMMRSTVCGHRQGLDCAIVHTPGRTVRGVIAGSFYQHQETYLTPSGETYWRGVLVFNDVKIATGEFDLCEVSLEYLKRRFG